MPVEIEVLQTPTYERLGFAVRDSKLYRFAG